MKKLHIALSAHDIAAVVADYTQRLGSAPCLLVPGQYALWRTETLNLSVRQDAALNPGTLRHLGWEDASTPAFTQEVDANGIVWERFSAAQQAAEINGLWPAAAYVPDAL